MPISACLMERKSSILPLNHSGSVSTAITLAPASAYTRAYAGAQASREIRPLDGEARLISAMRDSLKGDSRTLSAKFTRGCEIRVVGCLNIWRFLRRDLFLGCYGRLPVLVDPF